MSDTRLVAEVSSNHHGDLERCLRFVDVASECGASAVKFQQFKIDKLFAPEALERNAKLRERRSWELPEPFNRELATRARERGIEFASTPFYLEAVSLLEPWVDFFKIASYQLLWHGLLREVASAARPVVLATGMADLDEVRRAVDVLGDAGCTELTLLHCVSLYPTPAAEANLAAIDTLRRTLGVSVGWSDHTVDEDVVVRAVRRFDACMVELHLDLDGRGEEFGAGHCWLPGDVQALVARLDGHEVLADTHPADGDGRKAPRPAEAHERAWRSDPSDGLRPLRSVRLELEGGAVA